MILGGDIGGTNSRLALFDTSNPTVPQHAHAFPSHSYTGLQEIVLEYLKETGAKPTKACFGVAGTVRKEMCRTTNLPWSIDAKALSHTLGIPVTLLNDLEANAHGLRLLRPDEFCILQEGTPQKGNEVLLSAGTGLGEAGLYWDGTHHRPFASEGGHADFAAQDDEEIALFQFLHKENKHVSYERLVSGPGLYSLYRFLVETGRGAPCKAVESRDTTQDPSRLISELGTSQSDPTCQRVLDLFVTFYGAAAGNVTLHFLAIGGVYLGGGIAPHLVKQLQSGLFMDAFTRKGRFEQFMRSIPIRVILNPQTALLGAAEYLRKAHNA